MYGKSLPPHGDNMLSEHSAKITDSQAEELTEPRERETTKCYGSEGQQCMMGNMTGQATSSWCTCIDEYRLLKSLTCQVAAEENRFKSTSNLFLCHTISLNW